MSCQRSDTSIRVDRWTYFRTLVNVRGIYFVGGRDLNEFHKCNDVLQKKQTIVPPRRCHWQSNCVALLEIPVLAGWTCHVGVRGICLVGSRDLVEFHKYTTKRAEKSPLTKMSLTKPLCRCTALLEIPVSWWTGLRTLVDVRGIR